jgi:23S rRNA (uracil1939-C5)-methyltransferase
MGRGPHADELLELEVSALTHGPDAIARHDGKVIFVPGAAPGDRVRARVIGDRASYARAEVLDVISRGPVHRSPPCPWVTSCGGCAWQHVRYEAQLSAKARNVHEALARIAGVEARRELPIIAAPGEWTYRHRVRLHVDGSRALGFLAPRSHRVVAIDSCAIADPALAATLPVARRAVGALTVRVEEVELATNGRGGVVMLLTAAPGTAALSARDAATLTGLVRDDGVVGLRVRGRDLDRAFGDPTLSVASEPGAPAVMLPAGSFTQVNPAANQLLVAAAVAMAERATRVLDLFCGTGNLSLPLARRGLDVFGVDRDRAAIAAAANAAKAEGVTAAFEADAADRFLRRQGCRGADLVVLDPPRGGAADVAAQLARLAPPTIVYVACDPATLARDVRTLADAGYVVDRVQPIDLFPQTPHVETVLEARRR